MPLHNDNLYTMSGRVHSARPGAGDEIVRVWINDSIRKVINSRVYWTDLRDTGIISVPDEITVGTVSVTTGSNVVTGVATGWPINDVVNTTLAAEVDSPGFFDAQLATTQGINLDSVLWTDDGTPESEAVPIFKVVQGAFYQNSVVGKFANPHPLGATVWQSSLVGRQFRLGYNYPIFTVIAVPNPNTLILNMPWGGPPLAGVDYSIIKMYYTIATNIRQVIACVDQQQGIPLWTNRTQQELNVTDPQRTDNSDPLCFTSAFPNICKNQQWEIWPAPGTARQLFYLATLQWPELVNPEDLPPPFLDPTIFTDMAIARGLRHRLKSDDPFFDPKLAQEYERMAKESLMDALNGDEARAVQDYSTQLQGLQGVAVGANSTFALEHAGWEQLNGVF